MATKAKHKARSKYSYHKNKVPVDMFVRKSFGAMYGKVAKNAGLMGLLSNLVTKRTPRESKTRREAAD